MRGTREMVNVAAMRGWFERHFTSPIVGHIADWATLLGLVLGFISWTGLMAWAASSIDIIAEQGWGAVLFAAIGVTFVLTLMARALLPILVYFRPPTNPPADISGAAPATASTPEAPSIVVSDYANRIQRIELALSHLIWIEGMRVSKEILIRWIGEAPFIPEAHERDDLDIDQLHRELSGFREYLKNTGMDLSRMIFGSDYRNLILYAEEEADAEIKKIGNSPNDIPPYEFREWFIARHKVSLLVDFMKKKKSGFDEEMTSYLSTLNEQRRIIETKDQQG